MWVQSQGQEDPLEKEMATHSSMPAEEIPWTKEPDKLQSMGSPRVRHDWARQREMFDWRVIALNIVLVSAIHQYESATGIHVSLLLEPPSHLPTHPKPLGCHRALDLSVLHHNSKFPQAIYFTYGSVYVSMLLSQFVPPSPLSPCPQVYSLCLCLHCCPANRFIALTIFLDSIYMC